MSVSTIRSPLRSRGGSGHDVQLPELALESLHCGQVRTLAGAHKDLWGTNIARSPGCHCVAVN